ncbi:MAG: flavin reductase family protein [Armatimonadetes bacterium]|nr:flavin reductase family protein [Armatimonadota bacterium]
MAVTPDEFRSVLAQWASGLTVVTTWRVGGIHGMTASSFCSVSLAPPLILVCVDRATRIHAYIQEQKAFGVNLLRVDQEELSRLCAGVHGEQGNWLEGVPYRTATTHAPLLVHCLAWLDCSLWQAYDGGDHTIFVGQVEASGVSGGEPLLWYNRGHRRLATAARNQPPTDADKRG